MSKVFFDRELFWKLRADAKDRIRADSRLTHSARNLGAEIMDQVHADRRYAWCSEAWLGEKIGAKPRTVKYAIKQLREAGWLLRWRAGRNNRYVPLWLSALDDALSRQVLAAARASDQGERIGAKFAPIEGKVQKKTPIGAKKDPWIGAKKDPLSLSFIPFSNPVPVDNAPASAGDLTAAAAVAGKTQRELPLLRKFSGSAKAPKREAENAAQERLFRGVHATLKRHFADFIAWVPPELEQKAIDAEIAKRGDGVDLLVEAWARRAKAEGREPTHDELVSAAAHLDQKRSA